MRHITELLDNIKKAHSIESDSALAAHLGVTRQAVSNWRKGHALPDAVMCSRIAGSSGEPLQKVLGIVGEARAISREEKAVWRQLASIAACIALMVFGAPSKASEIQQYQMLGASQTIHYAKY